MALILMNGVKAAAKGIGIFAKDVIGKEVVERAVIAGTNSIEKLNKRILIPDLKDVPYEEAVNNLRELDLLPITAIAKPNVAYADSVENVVVNSEPKFGKKVDPKSTVKIYYVTSDVISKSIKLTLELDEVFVLPRVVGLDMYEAREDLEELGLRVTLKLESPNIKFAHRKDGQVTKVTYPDGKKLTQKQKKGERIWLYYVDEEVINESKTLIENRKAKVESRNEKMKQKINIIQLPLKKGTNKNKDIN